MCLCETGVLLESRFLSELQVSRDQQRPAEPDSSLDLQISHIHTHIYTYIHKHIHTYIHTLTNTDTTLLFLETLCRQCLSFFRMCPFRKTYHCPPLLHLSLSSFHPSTSLYPLCILFSSHPFCCHGDLSPLFKMSHR